MAVLLVLDTNVLLHAQRFDQLDWQKATGLDEIVLVVVPTVFRELDEQKWLNPKEELRERAKKISAALGQLILAVPVGQDARVREGVTLRHISVRSELPPGIDRRNSDEEIHASIAALRATAARIVFVSCDMNALVTARAKGVEILQLDGEYLWPFAPQERKPHTARAELEATAWIRGTELAAPDVKPPQISFEVPAQPNQAELDAEAARRWVLMQESSKLQKAMNEMVAGIARNFSGRAEPWLPPRAAKTAPTAMDRLRTEARLLEEAQRAWERARAMARRLSGSVTITNVARGAANNVTVEMLQPDPPSLVLAVAGVSAGNQSPAPLVVPLLMEGQKSELKFEIVVPDGFAEAIVKLRLAVVCVELGRQEVERVFRLKAEPVAARFQ